MTEVKDLIALFQQQMEMQVKALKEQLEAQRTAASEERQLLLQQITNLTAAVASTSGSTAVTVEEREEQIHKKKVESVLSGLKKGRIKEFVPGRNIKRYVEALEEECIVQCQGYGLNYENGHY